VRKIILLLVLISTFAFSAIDECKTDVYFGNGILTKERDAKFNAEVVLKSAIIKKLGKDYNKRIGKVSYAYNRSDGQIIDLLESLMQKVDGTGLTSINKWTQVAALVAGLMTQEAHDSDLDLQIRQYKASIETGHRVLVVAHSQGNLFVHKSECVSW
jgi:predicted small integral membrane protein